MPDNLDDEVRLYESYLDNIRVFQAGKCSPECDCAGCVILDDAIAAASDAAGQCEYEIEQVKRGLK